MMDEIRSPTLPSAGALVEARQKATPVAPEGSRKRSFTTSSAMAAKEADAAPARTRTEPAAVQPATAPEREAAPRTYPDPAVTGAIATPTATVTRSRVSAGTHQLGPAAAFNPERANPQRRETAELAKGKVKRIASEGGGVSLAKRPALRQERLSAAEKQAATWRSEPKPHAASTKSRLESRPQRVLAAAPARGTTVCLYFVLCF
jgi:hypothetical protein